MQHEATAPGIAQKRGAPMARHDFPFQPLAAAYTASVHQALPKITEQIAGMIAAAFQRQTRHVIDFSDMPPWDESGELVDTEMPFIVEDYPTVADFWEELAGYQEPSYESGRGWNFPTFGTSMQQDLASLLAPIYQQALAHLQHADPAYYQDLLTYIQQNVNPDARTLEDVYEAISFNEFVPDTEIACEIFVVEQIQEMPLVEALRGYPLPRHCQRTILENITNLVAYMDELAGYCTSHAHVTSANDDGVLQLHMDRTPDGVTIGEYPGARELLMDHIAHEGSLVLRCVTGEHDATGQPKFDLRGWAIEADATSITPHRITPDDLYEAMNTDADTGAKLPPEPNVRYL
jgi:hypothetical protein